MDPASLQEGLAVRGEGLRTRVGIHITRSYFADEPENNTTTSQAIELQIVGSTDEFWEEKSKEPISPPRGLDEIVRFYTGRADICAILEDGVGSCYGQMHVSGESSVC
jgi:hypothetical protein